MDFTNRSILRLAMEQSAIDAHCSPEDFAREENVVVTSVPGNTSPCRLTAI